MYVYTSVVMRGLDEFGAVHTLLPARRHGAPFRGRARSWTSTGPTLISQNVFIDQF